MSHRFFYGDEIRSGFIEMQAKGMAETMEVKSASCKACNIELMDKNVVNGLLADMRLFVLTGE